MSRAEWEHYLRERVTKALEEFKTAPEDRDVRIQFETSLWLFSNLILRDQLPFRGFPVSETGWDGTVTKSFSHAA